MTSIRNGKLNKSICGLFLICLLILLAGTAGAEAFAAGGETLTVRLPYTHTYYAAGNRTRDDFTYRLRAVDGAPMPQGSTDGAYDLTVRGVPDAEPEEGTLDLKIAFAGPGVYEYKVSAYVPEKETGFSYEDREYTVSVSVRSSGEGLRIGYVTILGSDGVKYDGLKFEAGHDAERIPAKETRPTSTPAGDGTVPEEGIVTAPVRRAAPGAAGTAAPADNTGAAAPAGNAGTAAPAGNAAAQNAPAEAEPAPEESLGESLIPKALRDSGSWALLNMVFGIFTLILGGMMLKRYFERIDTEDDEYIIRREGRLRLLGIIPAMAALAAEAVTQDYSKPMVLTDKWTMVMLAIFAVEMIIAAAAYMRYDRTDSNEGSYI